MNSINRYVNLNLKENNNETIREQNERWRIILIITKEKRNK